ncbi:hypothetical protein IMY05_C4949000100 [Salix suchowensis]|nr:hypothetical protein IMY05_C4949000100 [Salix suchowensis]
MNLATKNLTENPKTNLTTTNLVLLSTLTATNLTTMKHGRGTEADTQKFLMQNLAAGPMVEELSWQVSPEYSHFPTPPDDLHLHEAMQCILLNYSAHFAGASDIPWMLNEAVSFIPHRVMDAETQDF